jgi:hypothetical protein
MEGRGHALEIGELVLLTSMELGNPARVASESREVGIHESSYRREMKRRLLRDNTNLQVFGAHYPNTDMNCYTNIYFWSRAIFLD